MSAALKTVWTINLTMYPKGPDLDKNRSPEGFFEMADLEQYWIWIYSFDTTYSAS